MVFCCALLVSLWSRDAAAQGVVELDRHCRTSLIFLLHGTRVAAQRRNLQLEVPGESDGARAVLELRGAGTWPEFNWTIYTLRNATDGRRDFVLAIDSQRLLPRASCELEHFGSQLESVQWLSQSVDHTKQTSTTADAFRFELTAGQSITVGLEGRTVLSGARVYDVSAPSPSVRHPWHSCAVLCWRSALFWHSAFCRSMAFAPIAHLWWGDLFAFAALLFACPGIRIS